MLQKIKMYLLFFLVSFIYIVKCDYTFLSDTIVYKSDGVYKNDLPNYNGYQSIDALKFNTAFDKALSNASISKLILEKDRYYVPSTTVNFRFFCNQNKKPILIDFQGSTIIFEKFLSYGVQISSCFNLTMQNVIIKWDINKLRTTQGTITNVGPDKTYLTVATHAGYQDIMNATYCSIMDPIKKEYKHDTVDFGWGRMERNSSSTVTFYPITRYGGIWDWRNQNISVGDYLACRLDGGHHGITNDVGGFNKLINIQLSNIPLFGIVESNGEAQSLYDNIRILPDTDIPANGRISPLLSSRASGIHVYKGRVGPRIVNSIVNRTHDDGIAVHGVFSELLKVIQRPDTNKNALVLLEADFNDNLVPGVTASFVNGQGEFLGNATILSFTKVSFYNSSFKKSKLLGSSFREASLTYAVHLHLNNTSLVDVLGCGNLDLVVYVPELLSNGFHLENNQIIQNRARGMLIKASGTIKNNILDGSTMGGIVVTPELWCSQSGFVQYMNIIGNRLNNAGHWNQYTAPIFVSGLQFEDKGRNQRNLRIINNTISNSRLPNIAVSGVEGYRIQDNYFVNTVNRSTYPLSICPLENQCIMNSVENS